MQPPNLIMQQPPSNLQYAANPMQPPHLIMQPPSYGYGAAPQHFMPPQQFNAMPQQYMQQYMPQQLMIMPQQQTSSYGISVQDVQCVDSPAQQRHSR
jgi:hypothetical protein